MPLASSSAAPDAAPRGSTATGLAVTALIVGLIAAVLALVVAFLGLFSRYVWFLVVRLAVVALILGVLSMGRRGPARGSATGLAWIGVAAGMVALVLGVWGVTDYVRVLHANDQQLAAGGSAATSTQVGVPAPTPPPTPIQSQSGPQTQFGETYTMDGIAMQEI